MTGSFGDKCLGVFWGFFCLLCLPFFAGLLTSKIGATDGRD